MASWLDVGQQPRQADYVMVLNGGENTRPFAAAALVGAGCGPACSWPKLNCRPR